MFPIYRGLFREHLTIDAIINPKNNELITKNKGLQFDPYERKGWHMKRLPFLFIFLAIAPWAFPAELKILGGVSLSRSTEPVNGPVFDYYYKPVYGAGIIFGSGLEFNLAPRITLEIDALYIQKGSRVQVRYGDDVIDLSRIRTDELSFPALFKFHYRRGTSPYILGGGELAVVLAKDARTIDYGLVVGVGFKKQIHSAYLSLEGRYHHGLQDTNRGPYVELRRMRVFAFLVGLSI